MLIAKIKGIVLGCVALGAVITGAVVAQDPPPQATIGVLASDAQGAKSEVDHDRLRAVESKLDRILEALGKPRNNAPTAEVRATSPSKPATEAAIATTVASASSAEPAAEVMPASAAPGVMGTMTVHAAPDRVATVERRLADVERRLSEIERRLDTARAPAGLFTPSTRRTATPRASTGTITIVKPSNP